MLIVEKFYLLTKTDTGHNEPGMTMAGFGMNAAVITDLLQADRISLSEATKPRLQILSSTPTGHPAMDFTLHQLNFRDGKKLDSLITMGALNPKTAVAESLIRQAVLQQGSGGFLGLGKYRHPTINPEPERALRANLAAVLSGIKQPDMHERTLLAIMGGMDKVETVLAAETSHMPKKDIKHAISELVEESATGSAVQRMVKSMNAALVSTTIIN